MLFFAEREKPPPQNTLVSRARTRKVGEEALAAGPKKPLAGDSPLARARRDATGQVVAVVTLGATRLVADELERSAPEIQNAVCATGDAMGRYLTEIQSVDWLPAGIPTHTRGRPGLFDVDIPADSLPPAPAQPLAADKPKAAASRRVASFED